MFAHRRQEEGLPVECHVKLLSKAPDARMRNRVAELGLFTPNGLPGVTRISAKEAQQLQAQGAGRRLKRPMRATVRYE